MKRWFVWLTCGLAVAAFLLSGAASAQAAVIVIEVRDNEFSPDFVIIYRGDVVRWVWKDKGVHDTTAIGGYWDSGLRGQGATFKRRFRDTGQFDYYCTTHLDCYHMRGTIYVLPWNRPKP